MSSSLDALVTELQPFAKELVRQAGIAGLQPRVTSTRRGHFEQTRLWFRFIRGAARYPTAFPGTSAHEYGEAFDMVVTPYEALEEVGNVWKQWGGTWGGSRDPIHFELPGASSSHSISPSTHTIAEAVDLVLSLAPGVGEVELVATLLHWGFPENQVLEFLSSPVATLVG